MANRQPSKAAYQFAAYIPTLTGTLTCIGSAAIMSHILVDRKKMANPHLRIVLGVSFYDFLYSANKALIFLTYPKGQGIIGAQGNRTTCTVQGFFTEFAYAAQVYSAFLSIFFYTTICHSVRSRSFAKCAEPFGHISISVLFWTLASVGAAIGIFNPTGAFCYVAPYPPRCNGNPDVECEKFGDTYSIYYEIFGQFWIQISYIIVIYTNFQIWITVRRKEQRAARYEFSNQVTESALARFKSSSNHTRQVAIQATLYVVAFFLGGIFATMYHLIGWIGGYSAFWPLPIINTVAPLQGFWNALIYARPRYLRIQATSNVKLGFWTTLRLVFYPNSLDDSGNKRSNPSRGDRKGEDDQKGADGSAPTMDFVQSQSNTNEQNSETPESPPAQEDEYQHNGPADDEDYLEDPPDFVRSQDHFDVDVELE